jgi:hypothetical protein
MKAFELLNQWLKYPVCTYTKLICISYAHEPLFIYTNIRSVSHCFQAVPHNTRRLRTEGLVHIWHVLLKHCSRGSQWAWLWIRLVYLSWPVNSLIFLLKFNIFVSTSHIWMTFKTMWAIRRRHAEQNSVYIGDTAVSCFTELRPEIVCTLCMYGVRIL